MNKQQMKVVAVMLAVALAIAALVLVRGRAPAAQDEHAGESEQEEHKDDGVIRFTDAQVKAAGITLQDAGPMQMETFIRMPGQIALNEDRNAHVTPRAAGAVEKVEANLGQVVRKGDLLAVIASSDVAARRAALATAEQRRELARSSHALEKTLWEEKIGARQDYLKAEQELQEAEVNVQAARQSLQALGAGGAAGASNRLQVRSPFGGRVVE